MERGDPRRPRGWDDALGAAPLFLACLRALEARAEGDAPALLVGPAGAGKAHLARLLARRGPRGRGPLVVVDASRLAPRRLDVVLFGHDHGRGVGAFERAAGGVVLVRRIELVPPDLQQRLWEVVVQRLVRVKGQPQPHDARTLFTVRPGRSGEVEGLTPALAAELAPVRVRVPALSERPGDAGLLAERLVARTLHERGLGSRLLALTELGRGLFEGATWTEGVAQLEEVVLELVARRLRGLRAGGWAEGAAPPDAPADGLAPVDLAAARAVALAG